MQTAIISIQHERLRHQKKKKHQNRNVCFVISIDHTIFNQQLLRLFDCVEVEGNEDKQI